jgi:hypothetical protein
VTSHARFGVDPAELLACAAAAAEVREQVRHAVSALPDAGGRHAWAEDEGLAAAVRRVVSLLEAAGGVAADRAAWLDSGLRVSAESYARSDRQWVR